MHAWLKNRRLGARYLHDYEAPLTGLLFRADGLGLKSIVREADGKKVAQRFSAEIAVQLRVLAREAGDRTPVDRFAGFGFVSYDYPALKGWATFIRWLRRLFEAVLFH